MVDWLLIEQDLKWFKLQEGREGNISPLSFVFDVVVSLPVASMERPSQQQPFTKRNRAPSGVRRQRGRHPSRQSPPSNSALLRMIKSESGINRRAPQ
jgi:hypothetical protein